MNVLRGSTIRLALMSFVMMLVVAACGSGSDDLTGIAAPAPTQPAAASPLETELGLASEPGRRQYQLTTRQRNADEAIVQCMQQAGFFYAVDSTAGAFRTGAIVGDGSREWASINGLGITTSFLNALAVDASRAVPDAAAANLNYVSSLTAEEAAAYDRALVGDLAATPTTTDQYTPAGCWGDAYGSIVRSVALLDEFEPELASLNSRLSSDPRMMQFQQTWSACMQAADHRYENESAMVDDVYARLLEIELVETAGVTQVADPEALDVLSVFEREVALASFDCRQGFAGELDLLRFDYEQEFLDDNRFRIAELQPAVAGS